MKYMGHFLLLFFLLAFTEFHTHAQHTASFTMVLNSSSQLEVRGNANITDFSCAFERHYASDTFDVYVELVDDIIYCSQVLIDFPVSLFDCGNPAMNKDFRKTLQHEEHPHISLSVDKIYFDGSGGGDNYVEAVAELSIYLAGQANTYSIPFDNITFSDQLISFTGRQDVTFSSFDLIPPKALFGLVKVEDELDIFFDFDLSLIKKEPEGSF
ncbi:MAG: hypothetical protein RIF33_07390 [Cyclobacteriaceae bacterium]